MELNEIEKVLEVAGTEFQASINSPLKVGIDKRQCPKAYKNALEALRSCESKGLLLNKGVIGRKKFGAFLIALNAKKYIFLMNDRYIAIGRKKIK